MNHRNIKISLFNVPKHHSNKTIMAHININFPGNKFDMLIKSH